MNTQTRRRAISQIVISLPAIRSALSLRGWTYRDLLKVAGLSSSTLANFDRGVAVSPRVAVKIASAVARSTPSQGIGALIDSTQFDVVIPEADTTNNHSAVSTSNKVYGGTEA